MYESRWDTFLYLQSIIVVLYSYKSKLRFSKIFWATEICKINEEIYMEYICKENYMYIYIYIYMYIYVMYMYICMYMYMYVHVCMKYCMY